MLCCAQTYIHTILMRNNTLVPGGRLYKDDPAVLAWELQNEPQLREGYEKCDALQPSLLPWPLLRTGLLELQLHEGYEQRAPPGLHDDPASLGVPMNRCAHSRLAHDSRSLAQGLSRFVHRKPNWGWASAHHLVGDAPPHASESALYAVASNPLHICLTECGQKFVPDNVVLS